MNDGPPIARWGGGMSSVPAALLKATEIAPPPEIRALLVSEPAAPPVIAPPLRRMSPLFTSDWGRRTDEGPVKLIVPALVTDAAIRLPVTLNEPLETKGAVIEP